MRLFGWGRKKHEAIEQAASNQQAPSQPADASSSSAEQPQTRTHEPARLSWAQRLRQGLAKSSSRLGAGLTGLFSGGRIDDAALEALEDQLIMGDLGVEPSAKIVAELRRQRFGQEASDQEFRQALADIIAGILEPVAFALDIKPERKPHVLLVSGVNGAGKTTTIGKLAHQFQAQGLSVMLAAADTYRAAAVSQLQVWAERAGVPIVTGAEGGDPAAVAYQAVERAKREGCDVLIIDTAGRLHNKADLMAELQKVVRVTKKLDDSAPHDTLLVLDATTGQNAINQVATFKELIDVTGLIVTKLDGTARGGVIVGLADRFGLPIHAVGVGEGLEDLAPFDPQGFAQALVGLDAR
jgi:fused signal recognition particle receptor